MAEKTVSNYLLNLEKNVAFGNPVLIKAAKLFHELDQFEYDLGLLDDDDTTASKHSWWPIVTLIGGNSTAKAKFINGYLGAEQLLSGLQTSLQKFSLLLHSHQSHPTTLPGTAADVDPRYPFYQISRKINQLQAGEGDRLNTYLELRTVHSDHLKGKIFIDAPNISSHLQGGVIDLLLEHSITNADLALVFTDVFEEESSAQRLLVNLIQQQQDTNKFIYIIDAPSNGLYAHNPHEMIALWQQRLTGLGLHTGQFIVLSNNNFVEIEQRMTNVAYERSYRVLSNLDKSIRDLSDVVVPEVRAGISSWKERSNMLTLIVMGFMASLAVFAEITMGILEFLIDPIIGPIVLLLSILIMVPMHLMICKINAKITVHQLNKRQKELGVLENLSNWFSRSQTFWRMLLPMSDPIDWNKKKRAQLAHLTEKSKQLVQALNDSFSSYNNYTKSDYDGFDS